MGKKLYLKGTIINDVGKIGNDSDFFIVTSCGITYRNKDYFVTIKRPERNLIEYIVDGKGYIEYDGKLYSVEKGDSVVIRSGFNVKYYSDSSDPYVKLWFTATGTFAEAVLSIVMGKEKISVVRKNSYNIIEKLLTSIEKNGTETVRDSHAFMDVMYLMFPEKINTDKKEDNPETGDFTDKIKDYIDLFLRDGITVEKTAEHFHISKRYLIEQFKRKWGETPGKYMTKKRLCEAAELLELSDFTVGEISNTLGFCEPGYFTKVFTLAYGMSPKKYREEKRKNQNS